MILKVTLNNLKMKTIVSNSISTEIGTFESEACKLFHCEM